MGTQVSVLFDLDGTLLDHVGASNSAVIDALDRAWMPGHDLSEERVLAEWARLEALHMAEYLAGEVDFAEQRRRRLRGLLASAGDERVLDDVAADLAFKAYLAAYESHWHAFPDVAPTVRQLHKRGVPFAMLSNGDRGQQLSKAASLELPIGARVLVPADVGAAKPDAAAFIGACEALQWDPRRVLYVGDNPEVDARGSRFAGLSACWVNRTSEPSPFEADEGIHEIEDLRGLVELVQELQSDLRATPST